MSATQQTQLFKAEGRVHTYSLQTGKTHPDTPQQLQKVEVQVPRVHQDERRNIKQSDEIQRSRSHSRMIALVCLLTYVLILPFDYSLFRSFTVVHIINVDWRRWPDHPEDGLPQSQVHIQVPLHLHFHQVGTHARQFLRPAHLRPLQKYQTEFPELDLEDSSADLRSVGLLLREVQFLPKLDQHAGAGVVGKDQRSSVSEEVFVVQTKNPS